MKMYFHVNVMFFFFKCNFPLKMVIFPASHMTFYTGEVVDSTCWRCQCGKKEVVG